MRSRGTLSNRASGAGGDDREERVRVATVRRLPVGPGSLDREPHRRPGDGPAHDDVTIELGAREPRELHDPVSSRDDAVRGRGDAPAGAEQVADPQLERDAHAYPAIRGLDVRRLRVGRRHVRGDVPRADRGREPQLPLTFPRPRQALIDGDLGDDGAAPRDVANSCVKRSAFACSSSAAVRPCTIASSKRARADSLRSILPLMVREPMWNA